MNMKRASIFGVGVALGALVLGMTSLAWACTQVTQKFILMDTNRQPVGAHVTVTGGNWESGKDVTLQWATVNANGTDSVTVPGLARAVGGSFPVSFAVPDTGPGVYHVHAVQSGADVQLPFEVTSAAAGTAPSGGSPVSGTSSGSVSGKTAPVANTPPAEQPVASAPVGVQPVASTPVGVQPVASTPVGVQPVASTPVGAQPVPTNPAVSPVPGPAVDRTGSPVVSPNPVTDRGSSAQPVAAVGVGSTGEVAKATGVPAAAEVTGPSKRSASGDLWSGSTGSAAAGEALSEATSSSTSPVVLGAGLFVLGFLGLGLGYGITQGMRRRSQVDLRG